MVLMYAVHFAARYVALGGITFYFRHMVFGIPWYLVEVKLYVNQSINKSISK